MTVSQSAPRSTPNCVAASNATVAQSLTSPEFDFSSVVPEKLSWFMRRSATFGAPVLVECSTDGGVAWFTMPGDTLLPDGSAAYEGCVRLFPRSIAGMPRVRIRWRVVPAPGGSTGTLRFDDVGLTVHAAYDLTLAGLRYTPASPRLSDTVSVTGIVKNTGAMPASGFSLALYRNCGDTLHPDPCGMLGVSGPSPLLGPADTALLTLAGVRLEGGTNQLVALLEDTADMNPSDNALGLAIEVAADPGGVVINEIMFAPFAGEGEYVEFLNAGDRPVNLTGWKLTSGSGLPAGPKSLLLPWIRAPLVPGACAVVAEDSALLRYFPVLRGADSARVVIARTWETRLNNTGTALVLKDTRGTVVDSVNYSPSWHNPAVIDRTGRSLERIRARGSSNDPSNWSTCARTEGGTPAAANSVSITGVSRAGGVTAFPDPFSPDCDGVDDATVIRYRVPAGVWSVSVRIFDARGRFIRSVATCAPSTGSGECIWDGRDGERMVARMGIYIVLVEATDTGRLATFTAKGTVVLARRLR